MMDNRSNYREMVNQMGKKEFTLMKMQEYGFWPKDLPTPYERQDLETEESYNKRKKLIKEYEEIVKDLNKLWGDKTELSRELRLMANKYDKSWDYDKARKFISKEIMKESVARRKARKEEREKAKEERSRAWVKHKAEEIVYIGNGYSSSIAYKEANKERLEEIGLPVIESDRELATILGIEYKDLRSISYHRDVVKVDHYYRYTVPKKRGGVRKIAAPKSVLKFAQRRILEEILEKINISESAFGFVKGRSIVTSAEKHLYNTELLINMDLEDFFPSITFKRVKGMFKSLGYSGYISSILAMITTDCHRVEVEVNGEIKHVKSGERVLPQGAPSSPMITNIICNHLDKRLECLCNKSGFVYSRYADDMSFSLDSNKIIEDINISKFLGLVNKIVKDEGFTIKREKTKFLKKNNSQGITGITINNGQLGISKKWIKNLRAAIYNSEKLKENGIDIPIDKINEINGMINFAKDVNSERYCKLINKWNELNS